MIRHRHWVSWACALGVLLVLLLGWRSGFSRAGASTAANTLPGGKMKTVCVGRFVIDLPAATEIEIGRSFVSGFDLESTVHETDDQFQARLGQVETEISERQHELIDGRYQLGASKLESTRSLDVDNAMGKLWVYNRETTAMPEGGKTVQIESVSVRGDLRFPGLSIVASAEERSLHVPETLERFLRQIQARYNEEVPEEPGFCIGNALVRDPYPHKNVEHVFMSAGLPGHPDVNIAFSSMAGTAPAPGLLERHAKAEAREPFFMRLAFTTLRERQRSIHGVDGEELAYRVREPNFTTGYLFRWEARGKQDDLYAPLLTLELQSGANRVNGGKPVQSSLSEAEMIELWERTVRSIRTRPVKAIKIPTPSPKIVADA